MDWLDGVEQAAVTAFFCGDNLADNIGDGLLRMRRLEDALKTFSGHLQPYTKGNMGREDFNAWVEQVAAKRNFSIELLQLTKAEDKKAQPVK